MTLIRRIRDSGYTVLLIEHDMRLVMGVTDRIVVLEFGQKIAEGSPAEVARQPEGDRRLPGGAATMLLELEDVVRRTTAGSRRCTASASRVDEGEVVTLIGANGAGKTTTMRAISGLRPLAAGAITLRRRGHHQAARRPARARGASASRPRAGASSRA